jgi:hypothetical protein
MVATFVVLACVLVAAVVIVLALHHSATSTSGSRASSTTVITTSPATTPTTPTSTTPTSTTPTSTTPTSTVPTSTTAPTPTTAPAPTFSNPHSVQAAVTGANAATNTARSSLQSLSGFPTPTNVAVVINPYAYALQLYETFLSASAVPAAAWSEKIRADTQMSEDVRFLNTINGLPSLRLGTYMVRFNTVASQLQTTLHTLDGDLHSSKS